MMLRSRVAGMLIGLSAVALIGILPSFAQDPAKEKAAPTVAKNARRVPRYFGQVGLTDEQKEQIYDLRGKHLTKVDELKKQLADEQTKELAECEAILLESQKKVLVQLRVEGKAKSAARTKTAAEAKTKAAAEKKIEVKPDK